MRKIILGFIIVSVLLCGCGVDKTSFMKDREKNKQYTAEELGNLAQIEVYSGEKKEPLNVIDREEILYQYNQCLNYNDLNSEEQQKELEKSVEKLEEEYTIVSYKRPAALINNETLEKNTTITIYENSNIVKMTVSQESIKGAYVPEEFLIFYYEASDEDMKFYRSLVEE